MQSPVHGGTLATPVLPKTKPHAQLSRGRCLWVAAENPRAGRVVAAGSAPGRITAGREGPAIWPRSRKWPQDKVLRGAAPPPLPRGPS